MVVAAEGRGLAIANLAAEAGAGRIGRDPVSAGRLRRYLGSKK